MSIKETKSKNDVHFNRNIVSIMKNLKKQHMLFLFLLPSVIALIIFNYIPMVGLLIAFQDYKVQNGFFGSAFIGFEHFKQFLTDMEFYKALKNTIVISLLSILFVFPTPVILALMLDSIKKARLKRIFQTITYLPHFVSWVIVATLVYRVLDLDSGIVNQIIKFFGNEGIPFMRQGEYFKTILIITLIWKEIGWNSIIYLAAISGIDTELYGAAMVDGANKFKQLLYITLPGIMPTIILMFILNLGTLVHVNFEAVYNLMNPLIYFNAEVIDTYVFRTGIQLAKYSYATAIGFSQSLISVTLVFVSFKLSKRVNDYTILG